MRFQILVGTHAEDGGWTEEVNEDGVKVKKQLPAKVYKANTNDDIIETERDLCKLFNAGPGFEKFRRVDSGQLPYRAPVVEPVVPTPNVTPQLPSDTLESMTVAELKAMAAEEEIDLSGITHKADIINAIRNQR